MIQRAITLRHAPAAAVATLLVVLAKLDLGRGWRTVGVGGVAPTGMAALNTANLWHYEKQGEGSARMQVLYDTCGKMIESAAIVG